MIKHDPRPERLSTEMFAARGPRGFENFGPTFDFVKLCEPRGEIVRVKVEADQTGKYFAWWDSKIGKFVSAYDNRQFLEMEFPYGTKLEEQAGQGRVVTVRVVEL